MLPLVVNKKVQLGNAAILEVILGNLTVAKPQG